MNLQQIKKELIQHIKYSSIYNTPCPDWVYKLIQNFRPLNQDKNQAT